jgi:NAD(P)-dependent dehydrogenase (short-subunit alcohol dehydrogenase family)
MGRVSNKVALVTGGARGLGFAIARVLTHEGAAVMITDAMGEAGAAAAEQIRTEGGRCCFIHQDVTDEARWTQVITEVVSQFGGLDILVNNAGIVAAGSIEEETLEGWRKTQAVNLDGVFMGTKQAVLAMRDKGGSVINISSIEGLVGAPNIAAYNASKGGVRLLTKSAALHCAKQGYRVRVNSVHPGFILTDMVKDGLGGKGSEAWEQALNAIPVGAMGEPNDIAYGVLYLACDESKYVTGSELVIDGGYTAR